MKKSVGVKINGIWWEEGRRKRVSRAECIYGEWEGGYNTECCEPAAAIWWEERGKL